MTPEAFIQQIVERSGVLVEQAISRYGFAHRALHDYLAASAIVDQNSDAILLGRAAEERWREVILIAIRQVKPQARAEALLGALLSQSGECPASLALAGWSLAEGVAVRPALRASVTERLVTALNEVGTAGDFGLLTSALITANSTAARDWICATLTKRDSRMRQRVLGILPELDTQAASEFIPLIARLITDVEETPALRASAALALAKFNPELANSDIWAALESALRPENDYALKAAASWAWCELGRYTELGLVKVPAGEFLMGSDKNKDSDAYDNELPQHRLYLPTFYIARLPVTVGEWRAYCQASGHKPEYEVSLQGSDKHPAAFITWHESLAYAQWYGYCLPSEAEWEKAARGVDARIYPWGDSWQAGRANTREFWETRPNKWLLRLFRREVNAHTTPVGQFSPLGDSPYGCADMSGNVWEWTRSIYQPYPYQPTDGREELNGEGLRVLRGGSFYNPRRDARCAARVRLTPVSWLDIVGFRVGVVSPIFISGF